LYFKEVMHLLVEGGARTLTSFIREGLYDRVCIFLAPIFIGEGVRLGDLGIKRVEDAIRLKRRELKFFDGDIYLEMVRE
jgi:diaminohydroxyphosphoribosylaminopyrimidine deaminase/5-amino-6-(5-phosphoribosylamino)uracil reductase